MTLDRRKFLVTATGLAAGTTLLARSRPADAAGSPPRARGPAVKRFRARPRIALAVAPTPIEPCDRLRAALPGAPRIWIKRDDCLGYLCGGNKLRKLEYALADALAKKATVVLTVGGIQSNHARVTAMTAARLGLRCRLVMNGKPPAEARANFLVDKLLGVEITHVGTRDERAPTMAALAAELAAKGERPYPIPLGASNEVGALGMVAAFEEMESQARTLGVRFDAIVFSSSSGGTQAGLEVGKRLFKSKARLLGISPDDSVAAVRENVLRAMTPLCENLGLPAATAEELEVDERQIGPGYAIPSPASLEATDLYRKTEGLLLDPAYTAKAAAGLIAACRSGELGAAKNVLFWHTGGLIALFE